MKFASIIQILQIKVKYSKRLNSIKIDVQKSFSKINYDFKTVQYIRKYLPNRMNRISLVKILSVVLNKNKKINFNENLVYNLKI